jgi:hypothetical protein
MPPVSSTVRPCSSGAGAHFGGEIQQGVGYADEHHAAAGHLPGLGQSGAQGRVVVQEKRGLGLARLLGQVVDHGHQRRVTLLQVRGQQGEQRPAGERPVVLLENAGGIFAVQGRVAHEVAAALL